MGKFIVMDIVFYAGSLNYDQGSGNYQELKKITKWDGKQYTFVSRYALRYSLLETGRKLGLWNVAEGNNLSAEGQGDQKVIQPSENLLYSGEILKYSEFDLFGYLITSTTPQNFREAPVKISHAVSMTPFNYDALFNANLGLANRMRKKFGEMKPNPFTSEEHMTYYQYSVVIDVDSIGKIEAYKQVKINSKNGEFLKVWYSPEEQTIEIAKMKKTKKKGKQEEEKEQEIERIISLKIEGEKYCLSEIIVPVGEKYLKKDELNNDLKNKIICNPESEIITWKFTFQEGKKANGNSTDCKEDRIKKLIEALLTLKRNIKARNEDLSPKLLILGLYKNKPYKTHKDKIVLKDEYTEEEYDEIVEKEEDGKIIRKVIHKVTKSKKPIFEILESENKFICLEAKENIWKKIEGFFFPKENKNSNENGNTSSYDVQKEETYLFHEPAIEVRFLKSEEQKTEKV